MGILTRLKSWFRPPADDTAALRERNRAVKLNLEKRVLENAMWGIPDWVGAYQGALLRDYPDRVSVSSISTVNDRRAGRNFPFYLNENDLAVYRAPARILCGSNNYAMGLVRGLTGYIIGVGFTYRWQTKGIVRGTRQARDDAKNPLVKRMQEIWDEFAVREGWNELETELYWRDRQDGESFLTHGIDPNSGRAWVRTVEPEQVYIPTMVDPAILAHYGVPMAKAIDAWTFGILSDPEDVQTRHGYAIHNLLNPAEYDFEESAFVVHAKTWPRMRSIKRGMTDFSFDSLDAFNAAQKLRRNMTVGAAVQSAMAGIRQHKEASAAQVAAFQAQQAQATRTKNGRQVNYATLEPGSIIEMDGQSEFVHPPGSENANAHIEILQACLRGASIKYNAPEWLGSGQHDTSSFASSLTAESPFIKTGIMEQMYYASRRQRTANLVRQFAVEQRLIDPCATDELECKIEPPRIQVRNPEEQARVDQIYAQLGVKSPQQVAMEQGWDYDEQIANIKEHGKNTPQGGTDLPGSPGERDETPERGGQRFPQTREARESKDASGHEHKGKGKGGGQFTKGSGGDGLGNDKKGETPTESRILNAIKDGATSAELEKRLGTFDHEEVKQAITKLRERGLVEIVNQRLVLVPEKPKKKDAKEKVAPIAKPSEKEQTSEKSSRFGSIGSDHPLAGKSREQQITELGRIIGKARDTDDLDPIGLKKAGPPPQLDMPAFREDMLGALARYNEEYGSGPAIHDAYATLGKKYDLSKHDFQRAVVALRDDLRLSGSNLGMGQFAVHKEADPELVIPLHNGPYHHVIFPGSVASSAEQLKELARKGDRDTNIVNSAKKPLREAKTHESRAHHTATQRIAWLKATYGDDVAAYLVEAAERLQEKPEFVRVLEAFDESKHKRGQPDNAGQFGPGGGSKSDGKKDTKKEKPEEEEPFEWDGEIDTDRVDEGRSRSIGTASQWDGGDETEHDVYRWTTKSHKDGDWSLDKRQVLRDARAYAEEMHEEPEEEEDEDVDLDDIEEPDEDETPPPKVMPKKEKLGKSKAVVKVSGAIDKAASDEAVKKLFPKAATTEEAYAAVASAVGMPDDATVEITHVGKYVKLFSDDLPMNATGVRVTIKHPKMDRVSRFIGTDSEGKRFIRNEIIEVKPKYQSEGLGVSIFSKQVENASEEGFEYISTHAAGSSGGSMNGYYTWPRFGYNQSVASLAKHNSKAARAILSYFPDAKSVRDVMSTAKGREWWRQHGSDLHDARFSLADGSWSQYILAEYLVERSTKKNG